MQRLTATFRPQTWVNDYALDIDGKVEFDATNIILSKTVDELRSFLENNYDSDYLADDLDARQEHTGPFEVDLSPSLDDWFADNGIEDRSKITVEDLDHLRQLYGVNATEWGKTT